MLALHKSMTVEMRTMWLHDSRGLMAYLQLSTVTGTYEDLLGREEAS